MSATSRPTSVPVGLETPAVTRYHWYLLITVAATNFFEGFDQTILGLVAPYVARDFGVGANAVGLMTSVIGIGGVMAFVITMQADRFGRRDVLLVTVAGYALSTGLTALARGPVDFVILQFVARVFLLAEVALALVVVSEEIPARRRGFAISLVIAANVLGGSAAAFALGPAMHSSMGWRAMTAIGMLPLLLLVPLRFGLRETPRFAALDRSKREHPARGALSTIWREPYRRSLVLCILLFGLIGALVTTFPSFYAYFLVNERGFNPAQVSMTYGLAALMGLPAVPLAGWLLDRWGRRVIGIVGPLLGAIGLLIAFNATGSHLVITIAGMAAVFIGTFILPIQVAYISELFPTRIRSVAAGWISNGAGRALVIASPAVTGVMAGALGSVGVAASMVATCGLAAAWLVYVAMPETAGLPLEVTAGEAGESEEILP